MAARRGAGARPAGGDDLRRHRHPSRSGDGDLRARRRPAHASWCCCRSRSPSTCATACCSTTPSAAEMHLAAVGGRRGDDGAAPAGGRALRRGEPLAIIPTGGTSALGAIGYVNAAFELRRPGARRRCCRSRRRSSCRSAAAARSPAWCSACASAGLRSTVVGVLVTDILPPSPRRLAGLARGALPPPAPRGAVAAGDADPAATTSSSSAPTSAAGYGAVTEAGRAAQRLLARHRGHRAGDHLHRQVHGRDARPAPPARRIAANRCCSGTPTAPSIPAPHCPRCPTGASCRRAFHRFFT